MALKVTEETLAGWTGPSSNTEQDKQDRTERMIREAIHNHAAFDDMSFQIYAKGSYANNTNVKSDSDVDIVVECRDVCYWEEHDPSKGGHPAGSAYEGPWTPEKLRKELEAALEARFPGGTTAGNIAIRVHSTSSRVDADVVPCFQFKYYFSDGGHREGTKVFKKSGGSIKNYPKLQLKHGRAKNERTNHDYKKTVRILKRLENKMVKDGATDEVPSYLMECLIYNCPDEAFAVNTWTAALRYCVAHIFNNTLGNEPTSEPDRWLEVNRGKFLFNSDQKWSRQSAHQFASDVWDYMGYE